MDLSFKLEEEKKTGVPIFQYGERYGSRIYLFKNYTTFHAVKSHLFSTSLPMFLAGVERLENGKIVLQLTLMWLLSGASLCQNGRKREFFGQLPISTEDWKVSTSHQTQSHSQEKEVILYLFLKLRWLHMNARTRLIPKKSYQILLRVWLKHWQTPLRGRGKFWFVRSISASFVALLDCDGWWSLT